MGSCGDSTCLVPGVFFFMLYTVGIPVYVWYSLRQFASPQATVALGESPMLARYKSRLGFIAIFAKLLISGFFFAYLFRSSPFNSDKVDMLVTTSQLCTLATLFFALMMKIGFFEEEGVPKDVMGQILIY